MRKNLDRACRLFLESFLATSTETLTRIINVKGIRAILAHFTRIVHRLANELLTRHYRHVIGEFGLVRYTQIICARQLLHHQFIHFELLETALSCSTESFTNTWGYKHRLKGTFAITSTRIINTTLYKLGSIFQAIYVAKGLLSIVKHLFHFLLPYISRSSTRITI